MALNEMIAQGAQFKMPDPLEQYGRIAQIQQAQNQNALAQYQLGTAQRGDVQQNALYRRLQDPTFDQNNPENLASLAQFGTPGIAAIKGLTEARNAALTGSKMQGDIREQQRKNVDRIMLDLSGNPSNEKINSVMQAIEADPTFPAAAKAIAKNGLSEMLGVPINERKKLLSMYGMSPAERAAATRPQVVSPGASLMAPGSTVPLYTQPTKNIGTVSTNDFTPASIQKFNVSGKYDDLVRVPVAGVGGAGGAAGTGTIEVIDPNDPTKIIVVTKQTAVEKRLTPAKAMEGLPIKEKQRRESVFPKVKQAMTTVTNTMSTIEETIDRLLANTSGLNGVTGLVYGITPALTDAARQADADLGQLANLAFVQGITELRSSSSTGAGVGNVSNKEGDRFENLKSSLKRTQSFGDMKASLIRLKAQAQATKNIVNTEFEDMYEYRQAPAAAAPGKPAPAAAGVAPPPGFKRD